MLPFLRYVLTSTTVSTTVVDPYQHQLLLVLARSTTYESRVNHNTNESTDFRLSTVQCLPLSYTCRLDNSIILN